MVVTELNIIKKQSQSLLPKEKLELIKYLSESLEFDNEGPVPTLLKFGKYSSSGRKLSTEDDFKIAEWHPTEAEMNGD